MEGLRRCSIYLEVLCPSMCVLCVQNMSFEELKRQMYDLFTITLERIQILYVNPGKLLHTLHSYWSTVVGLRSSRVTCEMAARSPVQR